MQNAKVKLEGGVKRLLRRAATDDVVSRDEILWCYRNLLGREPESEAVVNTHLRTRDFRHLVLSFVRSQEFIASVPRVTLHSEEPGLPPFLDKLKIDAEATPGELAMCAAKIKKAWEHLGNEKAHYSVLTYDDFLPKNLNGSIEAFWNSGVWEASQVMRTLGELGAKQLEEKVCVEYGCGVGRVTVNFAKSFGRVHGYDISRNHLAYARARATEVGAGNIEFHECANDFRIAIEPCDFFYSLIVLQHNPPPIIVEVLRLAMRALKPGGIAIFQVPTYIVGYQFSLDEWLAMDHALDMQMHCVPQDTVFRLMADSGCHLLSVREDGWAAAPGKILSNTFYCQKS
jgi:SAM-dependent methyltransferase